MPNGWFWWKMDQSSINKFTCSEQAAGNASRGGSGGGHLRRLSNNNNTSKDHEGATWLSIFFLALFLRLRPLSVSESSLPFLPFLSPKHVPALPAGAPRRPSRPIVAPSTHHNPVLFARTLRGQVRGYKRQCPQTALSQERLWERTSPTGRRCMGRYASLSGMLLLVLPSSFGETLPSKCTVH